MRLKEGKEGWRGRKREEVREGLREREGGRAGIQYPVFCVPRVKANPPSLHPALQSRSFMPCTYVSIILLWCVISVKRPTFNVVLQFHESYMTPELFGV